MALAYQLAPPPVVGVFDTAYLGFAALWGSVIFADAPTPQESLDLALIALGTVMTCVKGRDAAEARTSRRGGPAAMQGLQAP